MTYFIRLNVISILYALIIFIPILLMGNVYRINRLTGWSIHTVMVVCSIAVVSVFIIGTVLHFFLLKKWLNYKRANYWTAILWLPYFIVLTYINGLLFPITYEGDAPNPSLGFLVIAILIVYPFYLLFIHFIGSIQPKK